MPDRIQEIRQHNLRMAREYVAAEPHVPLFLRLYHNQTTNPAVEMGSGNIYDLFAVPVAGQIDYSLVNDRWTLVSMSSLATRKEVPLIVTPDWQRELLTALADRATTWMIVEIADVPIDMFFGLDDE